MKPIKVLVVDDQHLFAESLKYVLEGEGKGKIEVTGTGENGKEAIVLAAKNRPDVILMDIRMPIMDGVEATAAIHKQHPEIKIMILTTFDDDELAFNALSNGASGYVLKNVDPSDLVLSIEAVSKGGFYISRSVGFRLFSADGVDKQKERLLTLAKLKQRSRQRKRKLRGVDAASQPRL